MIYITRSMKNGKQAVIAFENITDAFKLYQSKYALSMYTMDGNAVIPIATKMNNDRLLSQAHIWYLLSKFTMRNNRPSPRKYDGARQSINGIYTIEG